MRRSKARTAAILSAGFSPRMYGTRRSKTSSVPRIPRAVMTATLSDAEWALLVSSRTASGRKSSVIILESGWHTVSCRTQDEWSNSAEMARAVMRNDLESVGWITSCQVHIAHRKKQVLNYSLGGRREYNDSKGTLADKVMKTANSIG